MKKLLVRALLLVPLIAHGGTLYKSVGIAIQDVAAANLVYRKALDKRVGTTVDI